MFIDKEWIRPPVVAGTWYPSQPEQLAEMIDGYLEPVRPVDGIPAALIVRRASVTPPPG